MTQLVEREQVGILERFVFGTTRFPVPIFGEFCFGWSAEMSEKQDCGRAGEWQYSGNYGYWRAFLDGDVIQNAARGAGRLRSDAKTGSASKSLIRTPGDHLGSIGQNRANRLMSFEMPKNGRGTTAVKFFSASTLRPFDPSTLRLAQGR